MLFSILLLVAFVFLSFKAAPKEREEDTHVHGAGQVGVVAAVALFGIDYFTSFFYATGEMMSSLHPYGLQHWGYIAVGVIALANFIFGVLYMYSLGIFTEGGGSYTASMRYLVPGLSLIVAVVLIQDYIFTIVVSTLSGVDQLLSITGMYHIPWFWHFILGAALASVTYFITIRGRGESAKVGFTALCIFFFLTITMTIGLVIASAKGVPAVAYTEIVQPVSFGRALYHLLTASMKGLVALSGLEAMSDGIQFIKNEDFALVRWGKQKLPKWKKIWDFYSGKSGIGRMVQTSFLFYGGITTFILATFAIRFNVFDGTLGRTLVGNLAHIGFGQIPGGIILFWVYQILAVILLAFASLTAFQDLQATAWRDVAIGEVPEIIVHRNEQGTFTRSVTVGFIIAVIIQFLVGGKTSLAVPYYGIGVYMPIMVMGLSIRQHILKNYQGRTRFWGSLGAGFAAVLSAMVFIGQIVGKWEEGGWIVLISFSVLIVIAHLVLISPIGHRSPEQIYRIVREKARVEGRMGSIVEWQSLKMQGYRYQILLLLARFFEIFGIRRPVRYDPPPEAGDYDGAIHLDNTKSPSFLEPYIKQTPSHKSSS